MAVPVSISQTIHGTHPRVPFQRLKDDVLGADYELSLAFVGNTRATALNKKFKGKNTPTNVLAFPLADDAGEIIINPHRATKEAAAFGHTPDEHLAFLYIHALLHLKGYAHGSRMESKERELMRSLKT